MDEPHTTPERRAELRRKYGGVPPRSCGRCGGQTLTEHANERGVWWRCTWCGESGIADLDSDIVSALDDADALAGALDALARERWQTARARGYVTSIATLARDGMHHEDHATELYEALEWIDGDARNALAALDADAPGWSGGEGESNG